VSAIANDRSSNAVVIRQVKLQRQRPIDQIQQNQKAIDRAHRVASRLDKVLDRGDRSVGLKQGVSCADERQRVPSLKNG
jgi:hypothetical protein